MIKGKGFEMIISSDNDYEELCAEIYFNGEFVGIITQEEGIYNPMIEFYPPKGKESWKFNFFELIEFLKTAESEI